MKKCSKKVIAASMAAAMVAATGSMSVMAAEADTKDTTVKYAVTQGYEWSIHSDIDFDKDKGINTTVEKTGNSVKVTKNVIPDGKKLQITVTGSGANNVFEIANRNTKLSYTIKAETDTDTTIGVGATVLEVAAGTNTGSKDLTFTLNTGNGAAEVAGTYTGTVTYTASIVNAN